MGKKVRFSHFLYGVCGLIVSSSVAHPQTIEGDVKTYANSVAPLPTPSGPAANVSSELDAAQLNTVQTLSFRIKPKNRDMLRDSGKTLTREEIKEAFSGSPEDAQKIKEWLEESGFSKPEVSRDNKSVSASATVAKIQESLHVKMVAVSSPDGSTEVGASPSTPPELPKDVAVGVDGIDGLQPWVRATTKILPSSYQDHPSHQSSSSSTPTTNGGLEPSTAATSDAYLVANLLSAYNANNIGVTGKGQTIAILIDVLPLMDDLKKFWRRNNLNIQETQIKFIPLPGDGKFHSRTEATLDTEWASGIAPGANISVYAAGSLDYGFLNTALNQIVSDALDADELRTVSISLGLREDKVSKSVIDTEDDAFSALKDLGVTVFISSGDAGSNPDETGHSRGNDVVVEYGAADDNVVAVGGTTLKMDEGKMTVISQTAWFGSGGGVSKLRPRPAWQAAYPGITDPTRLVPDVSAVADPNPGALVILDGQDTAWGGTSWSTPVWAGFNALLAEKRSAAGHPPLGFLSPHLYDVAVRKNLHDITEGTNGAYNAGPGWNPVTGLGVPDLAGLASALQ